MCVIVDLLCFFVFFFKQKTAYEMRISDWSSDVCSSDLLSWRRALLWLVLVCHRGCLAQGSRGVTPFSSDFPRADRDRTEPRRGSVRSRESARTKRIDQIHTVDGSPKAIPFDRDLIYRTLSLDATGEPTP